MQRSEHNLMTRYQVFVVDPNFMSYKSCAILEIMWCWREVMEKSEDMRLNGCEIDNLDV